MQISIRSTVVRVAVAAALAGGAYAAVPAGAASSVDQAAAKLVPASIKSKGTISVASDASYAPNEFIAPDGKTVIGMDVDLIKAISAKLGLKVNVTNVTFDAIIPDLHSGKYDVGISSFTDNKTREKIVNFVDYFKAGTSFFVAASGGPKVTNLASLCGLTVSVETGTTEQADAEAQAKKCSKKLTVLPFPSQNNANLALSSGRAQVSMADSPVAEYQVKKSGGRFKLAGKPYGVAPYGIAVPKDTGTFDKAILAALNDLIKSGQYTTILKKWGVQAGAITQPKLNGAIS